MQPPLAYVAPELANADGQTATSSITTAADIFSLGESLTPLQGAVSMVMTLSHSAILPLEQVEQ